MKQKLLSLMSFLVMLIIASCSGDKTEEEILPINPTPTPADTVEIKPETPKAPLKYYQLKDGFENPNTIAYLFEDSCLLTLNPDTLFGNTVHIGKLQENGEWNEDYNIVIFADTLYYPQIIRTKDEYYIFDYSDSTKVAITLYDLDNNELEKKVFSLDLVLANQIVTRAEPTDLRSWSSVLMGYGALIMHFLQNKNAIAAECLAALCTSIGLAAPDSIDAGIGVIASLLTLLSGGTLLAWLALIASVEVWFNELDNTWSRIFWGENPTFVIDSITTSSDKATIYFTLEPEGDCYTPLTYADLTYTKDKKTLNKHSFHGETNLGKNKHDVYYLDHSTYYEVELTAMANFGVGNIFGKLHTYSQCYTKAPVARTLDVENIGKEEATILCRFFYVPIGGNCYIKIDSEDDHKVVSCTTSDMIQHVRVTGLKPFTDYKCSAYIEYKGETWLGEEKNFTTLPPEVDGTWNVTQGDGDSYTITFDRGKCSWSKKMIEPGSYTVFKDGTIGFTVQINYGINTMWWDIAYFSGKLDNMYNPQHITGTVFYGWSSQYSERIYVDTTFEAYR